MTAVPLTSEYVRGTVRLETTPDGVVPHRLPAAAVRQAADPQIAMVEAQPAGVRVAFRTAASAVTLVGSRSRVAYAGVPARPDGVVELVVDGAAVAQVVTSGGVTRTVDMRTGAATVTDEGPFEARFALPAGAHELELWLPHNETVSLHSIEVDGPVEAVPAGVRWVHHGSSISQGSNATRPTRTWPVLAARAARVDLTNLGLGGGAMLDQFTARTMRDLPADVLSVKIGINLVNGDLMRMRAFRAAAHGFLDTVRDGHPDTPLWVITPLWCGIHEDTPGPGAFDVARLARGEVGFVATGDPAEVPAGRLTLGTLRAELARLVTERRADDPHLHLVDGLALYGEADAVAHPLPDALHPDEATHALIAERFTRLAPLRLPESAT